MANAKELAREYRALDGQCTFHMIPWSTIMFRIAIGKLEKLLDKKRDDFDPAESFFPAADALTADITFADELTPEVEALKSYWQSRNGDMSANFDGYLRYLSDDVYVAWLTAYSETRDRTFATAPDLATPPDDDPKKKRQPTKPAKN